MTFNELLLAAVKSKFQEVGVCVRQRVMIGFEVLKNCMPFDTAYGSSIAPGHLAT